MTPQGLTLYQHETSRQAGGGLLGIIGRGIKGLVTGGPLGAVAGVLSRPAARPGGAPLSFGGGGMPVIRSPGVGGFVSRMLPGGSTGYEVGGRSCTKKDGSPRRMKANGQCWKRPSMNVGNARAARRAITRIKGVRKMLQSIEREMPKQRAATSSKGKRCGCK